MTCWAVEGVELPFGDTTRAWWVDASGTKFDSPPGDAAEALPGRYVLDGLVDAHAHPAIVAGPHGPKAASEQAVEATLLAWAEQGITLVRDVGSPNGLTLTITAEPRHPLVHAAGRFLAPEHRYFPELLVEPVSEDDLIAAALDEIGRGATWVKVIGDFPHVPDLTEPARTYPVELIARLAAVVHTAGARVAVHTTLPDVGNLVTAGIDSVEHGTHLDADTIEEMGRRGTAWTPTLCAVLGLSEEPGSDEEHARRAETRERLAELLPLAIRHGVPVLAGTDVIGQLPREVALLSDLGLEPADALAAASSTARHVIDPGARRADIVTYHHDPRHDPTILQHPAAVVVNGFRIR